MKQYRIGMIGSGASGRAHLLGFHGIPYYYGLPADTVRVVGVATSRAETAQAAAREIGCEFWTDDYHELIARDDIDVVAIATPNNVRVDVVLEAAAAGKHIFCEKPLARTVTEARRMVEAVEAAGVTAQVNFNFRFYPAVQRARRLVEEGFLGQVSTYRGTFYRSSYIDPQKPLSWKLQHEQSGGGALYDLGSHTLDMATFLLGEVEAVFAVTETFIRERPVRKGAAETGVVDVDDVALLELRMASGALGSIQTTRLATGVTNELSLEIFGERGALRFDSHDPSWLWAYSRDEAGSPVEGFHRVQTGGGFAGQLAPDATMPPGIVETFAASQYAFLRAIEEGREPTPSFREALHVQAIMQAAQQSAAEGRWVRVDEVG